MKHFGISMKHKQPLPWSVYGVFVLTIVTNAAVTFLVLWYFHP